MRRIGCILIVCLLLSLRPVKAATPYETATKYIGQSAEALIRVIGQPIRSEVSPNCIGQGQDAIYEYPDFTVYATGDDMLTITAVKENVAVQSTSSETNVAITGKDQTGGKWKRKNGYFYYEHCKGLTTINGRTYMFDQHARQQTGWMKIKNSYYFFKIANGAGGYMMTKCSVNGMKCDETGKAKGDEAKLKVLVMASDYVHKNTRPADSRYHRYRTCYQLVIRTFRYGGSHIFRGGNWSVHYAYKMLKKHKQVCWGFAGALAYMANACGYTDVKVQATKKHGWAKVNGKLVDGSYGRSHQSMKWFMFKPGAKGRLFPSSIYKHPTFSVKV